jgi:peroxiredoxin
VKIVNVIILIVVLSNFNSITLKAQSQELISSTKKEYLKGLTKATEADMATKEIMLDGESIPVYSIEGEKIKGKKFMDAMMSGNFTPDFYMDGDGEIKVVVLRKATDEEKKMMEEMMMNGGGSELIGKDAPAFKMEDINGNTISSKDAKGKVIVLNFWFIACKPCKAEIPELNEVYEKYKENPDVVFASVTFDKSKKVKSFLKKHPIKYPVVSDAKEICKLFNIFSYPTNIIIDKNGKYFDYVEGGFPKIGQRISGAVQNALDD